MSLKKSPKILDRFATTEEVRSYLTQILTEKYTAHPEFAEEACASWKLGRGAELHDANLEYFQQIFGNEVGFCLYGNVLKARQKAWQDSYAGIACVAGTYISLVWTLWYLHTTPSEHRSPLPIAVLGYGLGMFYWAQDSPDDTYNHRYLRNYMIRCVQLGNGIFFLWLYFHSLLSA
ncbi:hypothetical protein ASPCAL11713 [Aspergillus calidoustus]|uniref:Uncharacterized protein n=1 Tax=Aspergillus calidoustus TaxID=454130 RepID=A0A0U5H3U9_ASPCI|nr:hypothetical protein ASPCAL11713 [Aspergillus calidoustus]